MKTLFSFHVIPLFCYLDTNIPKEERKAEMVSMRLFSFVLVFILVLIGESSAQSQVMETILAAERSGLVKPARKNLPRLGKEAYDAVPAAAEVGNSRLEGRKMMLLKWDLDKKTALSVEVPDEEETAKISGKVTNAFNNQIGSSQEKFKNQKLKSQKLLGAVKELMSFMNEDYQKPPTKPPVHNKAPLDQEQAIP